MDLTPATFEELAAEPVGRYFAGATFLHFCFSFELWGVCCGDDRAPMT